MPTTGILAIREAAKIPQCMPDLSTVQIFFVSQEALNTLQADFINQISPGSTDYGNNSSVCGRTTEELYTEVNKKAV